MFITRKKKRRIFEIFQKLRVVFSLGNGFRFVTGEAREPLETPRKAGLGGSTKAYIIKSLPMDL